MKQKTKGLTIISLSAVAGALLYVPLIQAFKPHGELVSEMTVAEIQKGKLWRRDAIKIKLAW